MKVVNFNTLVTVFFFLSGGFFSQSLMAQENRPMDKIKMEAPNDNLSWQDYKQDLHVKYQHVLEQVNHMQKEYAEKNMKHPDFKKSLTKFESNLKKFGERMKNADAIAADKQARFRKKTKSELSKLNKEYVKIRDRWETINHGNISADNHPMNWDEYRADLKAKYQHVMNEVDKIRDEAKAKQISAPEFKASLDQFEERARDFAERMKNSDAIPNDKQEEYRQVMKEELAKLNNAYDSLKQRWENLRK